MTSTNWREISAEARRIVDDAIPSEWRIPKDKLPPPEQLNVMDVAASCGLLTERELTITESYATAIVNRIAAGEWKAEDVTRAFCKRAAIAHQLTNCLTVIMFEEGLAQAKKLDEHFAKTGKVVGPLHGLPISLKDNFNIPGRPSSVGFCSLALEAMEEESVIVGVLRDLGAVAYVKTNVPTAMMMPETVNNCYGRTVNPLNRDFTSGGSSGGESALITLRGSPLGVGTDIGGSLRIPAACTGLFTIRPSYGRFPNVDARSALAGQESVSSVHGPLARSIQDVELYASAVIGSQPWLRDPKCTPLPWRSAEVKAKPKIAVLWGDGIVTPTPPVKRALTTVVERLKARGYEILDWSAEGYAEVTALVGKFFTADGGRSIRKLLEPVGEPWRPEMMRYAEAPELGVYDLWQLQKRRTIIQKTFVDRWAAYEGLDAILGPTTPYAAPKNGQFKSISYTGIFNLLDYSSASFPTGLYADKEVDVYPPNYAPLGKDDEVAWTDYDAEAVHGMPISLQLSGRRLEDEKILLLLRKICEDIA